MSSEPLIVVKDASVRVHFLHPAVWHGIYQYRLIRMTYGLYTNVVITSGHEEDTYHSHTSLHWDGRAADLRSNDIPRNLLTNVEKLWKEVLGRDFDVVLEAANTNNEHFHLELQPKRRLA